MRGKQINGVRQTCLFDGDWRGLDEEWRRRMVTLTRAADIWRRPMVKVARRKPMAWLSKIVTMSTVASIVTDDEVKVKPESN